jgi:hypothetical protein
MRAAVKKWLSWGQRGNAVLSSIVMAGLVAGAATVAYRNFSTTYSSTRVGRVKAKQTVVEAQVRRRALQPEAYLDCNSAGLAACKVNQAYFSDLGNQNVAGARCDDKRAVCGVTVRSLNFAPGTRTFSAEVAYAGSEANVKPVQVRLEIPLEVLQAPRFHCGEKDKTKPIFVGFRDGTGEPICEGFNACPVGKFVKGVDVSKRTLICQDLPQNVACGEQSMFTRLGWQGHSVDYDCSPLPEPPFTSNLTTRALASTTETVTNSDTVTVTSTSTGTGTSTSTSTASCTTNGPLRWLNDTNYTDPNQWGNPRPGDPPSSAVCGFCYVGAPGANGVAITDISPLALNRDNGACSAEGEKCWCKNVFACRRDCEGGPQPPRPVQGRWKFNTPTNGDIYSVCWAGVYTAGNCSQGYQSNRPLVIPVNLESGPGDCPDIPDFTAWGNAASAGDGGPCREIGSHCKYRTPGTPMTTTGTCNVYTTSGPEHCGFTCRQ